MMNYNSTKLMFFVLLIMGSIFCISSYSWFSMWMGLEINLLSFIMIMSNYKNMMNTESSMKYFMVQALTSTIFLFTIIFLSINMSLMKLNFIMKLIMNMTLMFKMGAAPFHWWFIEIIKNMNWISCLILMTWQKIAPMIILSYFMEKNIIFIIIIYSIIIGSIGGINQSMINMIMGYSSINNLGWMLMSMLMSKILWNLYFILYSLMNLLMIILFSLLKIFHINQSYSINNIKPLMKFMMLLNILSLGGLPPFMGFLPKWMALKMMLLDNMLFLSLLMMMMSLITLFYYLQINFSSLMLNYFYQKFNNNYYYNNYFMNHIYIMTFFLLNMLMLSSMIIKF
uniref:NADH-ubiquinone oxidoreductase chain 2 n=1 Tax=Cephalcia infumata TaxID=2048903 RepID=A0A8H2SJ20_9HYME|nr:NADH dehydrogenase subunit 2 [Cephalcia infumata]